MNTENMVEDIDDLRACILATVEAWLANQNTTVAYKKRTAVAAMTIALFEQAKTFGAGKIGVSLERLLHERLEDISISDRFSRQGG